MDYNRERLYTSERVAFTADISSTSHSGWVESNLGTANAPNWRRVLRTDAELLAYLRHLLQLGGARCLSVALKARRRQHGASYHGIQGGAHTFSFSQRTRVTWVAVHEVAHALNREARDAERETLEHKMGQAPRESHGPEFCQAYVQLTALEFGAPIAERLLACLNDGGCRTTLLPLYVYAVALDGEVRRVVTTTPHRAAREAWLCPRTTPGMRIQRLHAWTAVRYEGRLVLDAATNTWIPRGY